MFQRTDLVHGAIALAAGVLFCIAPWHLVIERVLRLADDPKEIPPPQGVDQHHWQLTMTVPNRGGAWMLGLLERLVTLVALTVDAPVIIVAWLAFKVASKWEVWGNVIQVSRKLEGTDEISFLSARRRWGAIMYMRFLLGTLLNLIIGMAAFGLTWSILVLWSAT